MKIFEMVLYSVVNFLPYIFVSRQFALFARSDGGSCSDFGGIADTHGSIGRILGRKCRYAEHIEHGYICTILFHGCQSGIRQGTFYSAHDFEYSKSYRHLIKVRRVVLFSRRWLVRATDGAFRL